MFILKDNRNGKLYRATLGTEFSSDWFSCYPIPYAGPGFPVALAPDWVTILSR